MPIPQSRPGERPAARTPVRSGFQAPAPLGLAFARTRAATLALCEPLEIEDFGLQSMPDASPVKWHLAHTTWFYEEFLLREHDASWQPFHPGFRALFNSYYQSVGSPFARADRGKLSRPTVAEVMRYRAQVDSAVARLLDGCDAKRANGDATAAVVALGIAHEQQHQELLLTDLKHAFARNPLRPVYRARERAGVVGVPGPVAPQRFHRLEGGLEPIGHDGRGFAFDNETPRHRVYIEPFQLADRLVTVAEFREFVRAGGYRQPEWWLADGWDLVQREAWTQPLYWSADQSSEFTLSGERELEDGTPVSHLSCYEADAYARWAGARLPTEQEWELAAAPQPVDGNLLESRHWHPSPAGTNASPASMQQLFGDVWDWTRSSYSPYPGYRAPPGPIGEYNGKFMSGQVVLRGGSCVSPREALRASYRNFFPPSARWQFSGLRLAKDG